MLYALLKLIFEIKQHNMQEFTHVDSLSPQSADFVCRMRTWDCEVIQDISTRVKQRRWPDHDNPFWHGEQRVMLHLSITNVAAVNPYSISISPAQRGSRWAITLRCAGQSGFWPSLALRKDLAADPATCSVTDVRGYELLLRTCSDKRATRIFLAVLTRWTP